MMPCRLHELLNQRQSDTTPFLDNSKGTHASSVGCTLPMKLQPQLPVADRAVHLVLERWPQCPSMVTDSVVSDV
jgi:hypothetical protein